MPVESTTTICYLLNYADTGAQPLVNEDGSLSLAVNGEIYNHRVLRRQLKHPYNFKTHSDCEVILPLVRIEIFNSQETIDTL